MNDNEFLDRFGPAAIITGASSGIGKSFANILAAKGFDLVLIARRVSLLEELAAQLKSAHHVDVSILALDLSETSAPQKILQATELRDVGLIVSNAGFGFKGEYTKANADEMSDMLLLNCHAPMLLARGFIPRLRQRGKGGIILTSSIEGFIGCPYSTAYAASKAFVNSLGEGLWAELKPENIDVLTLCPGATDTEMPRKQGIDPATLKNMQSPDEVVQLALANIQNGPTFIPSAHYKANFEKLISLPRPQALMAIAQGMKK